MKKIYIHYININNNQNIQDEKNSITINKYPFNIHKYPRATKVEDSSIQSTVSTEQHEVDSDL